MNKTGEYIYGIINSGTEEIFEVEGIEKIEEIYPFTCDSDSAKAIHVRIYDSLSRYCGGG